MADLYSELGIAPPAPKVDSAPTPAPASGSSLYDELGIAPPQLAQTPVETAPTAPVGGGSLYDELGIPAPQPPEAPPPIPGPFTMRDLAPPSGPVADMQKMVEPFMAGAGLIGSALQKPVASAIAEDPTVFPKAVGRGIVNLGLQTPANLTALGATAVGNDELAQKAMKFSAEAEAAAQAVFATKAPEKVEDIRTAQDITQWALNAIGEQVPNIGATMLGSYVGQVALMGTRLGAGWSTTLGAAVPSTLLETSATTEEQYKATGKIHPAVAVTAGVAKGVIDGIIPAAMARRLGIGQSVADRFKKTLLSSVDNFMTGSALRTGMNEGATEGVQEVIDIAARKFIDENYDAFGPEAASRVLNATATGAVAGSSISATLNAFSPIDSPTGNRMATPADSPIPSGTRSALEMITAYETGVRNRAEPGPWNPPKGWELAQAARDIEAGINPMRVSPHPVALMAEEVLKQTGLWSKARAAKYHTEAWMMKYGQDHGHVARQNPDMPALQDASIEMDRFDNTAKDEIADGTEVYGAWKSLGHKKAQVLGAYLQDLEASQWGRPVVYQVVDDKGEVHQTFKSRKEGNAYVRVVPDLGLKVKKFDPSGTAPTEAERSALAQKHGLDEKQLEVAAKVEDYFKRALDKIEEAYKAETTRFLTKQLKLSEDERTIAVGRIFAELWDTGTPQEIEAALERSGVAQDEQTLERLSTELIKIKEEMDSLRKSFYFPSSRFGDYLIVGRENGKVVHTENYEHYSQRDDALREMQKEFPDIQWAASKVPASTKAYSGLPSGFVRAIGTQLKLTKQQQIDFEEISAAYLPARSFANRLRHKKRVAGASTDAMRSFASYANSFSRHLARLKHGDIIKDHVNLIGRMDGPGDFTRQRTIQDYMQWVLDERIMRPQSDWWRASGAAFMFHLGWNVSSAAVNLTQPFLFAWPHLSASYGASATTKALSKAYFNLRKAYFSNKGLPQDVQWALELGQNIGHLKESLASDLVSASESSAIHKAMYKSGVDKTLNFINQTGTFLFRHAEEINRYATFLASYELAKNRLAKGNLPAYEQRELKRLDPLVRDLQKEHGVPYEQAAAYILADNTTKVTMFDYSASARPKLSGGVGRVFLPFYNFILKSLQFYGSSPGKWRALGLMFLIAGYSGLPGSDDLLALAKLAARLAGKHFDPQASLRAMLKQWEMNPDYETYMRRGIGAALPFDIGSRLSAGRIVPGLADLPSALNQGSVSDALGQTAQSASGAALAIPLNVGKAMFERHPSTIARLQTAAPTAIKNVIKGSRILMDGGVKNRAGDIIQRFDMTNPYQVSEVVGQFMGFNPQDLRNKYDTIRMTNDAIKFWVGRRDAVLFEMTQALKDDDSERYSAALERLTEYNKEAPHAAFKIGPKDATESIKGRLKQGKLTEMGIPTQGKKYAPYAGGL